MRLTDKTQPVSSSQPWHGCAQFGVFIYLRAQNCLYIEVDARGPSHAAELAIGRSRKSQITKLRVVSLHKKGNV
jgi:hypothetical protein